MGAHILKTTIDLSDELAEQAKALALRERTTLREVIERGIRLAVEEAMDGSQYHLPDLSVKGRGLQREFRGKNWKSVLEAAYGYSED